MKLTFHSLAEQELEIEKWRLFNKGACIAMTAMVLYTTFLLSMLLCRMIAESYPNWFFIGYLAGIANLMPGYTSIVSAKTMGEAWMAFRTIALCLALFWSITFGTRFAFRAILYRVQNSYIKREDKEKY